MEIFLIGLKIKRSTFKGQGMNPSDCHIVVVDDEVDLAEILTESLELEDFKVSRFHSAEEALKRLKGEHFDVVISDSHMPGMNGLTLLENLKKQSDHDFLFYLCTGDMEVTENEIIEKGGAGLFCKPYNLFDLVQILKNQLADAS